jgi:hypothetical protein
VAEIRIRITDHKGFNRSVTEDDFTILIGQDGTAFISLVDRYANERLLSPEQTEQAIEELEA